MTLKLGMQQDQDQDSLLVKRRNDNHSPGDNHSPASGTQVLPDSFK